MTNIEKKIAEAGATVLSEGPAYVRYGIDGIDVIIRPTLKSWTVYPNQLSMPPIASEYSEDKSRKLLSSYKKCVEKMEEFFDMLQGMEDPWKELGEEEDFWDGTTLEQLLGGAK